MKITLYFFIAFFGLQLSAQVSNESPTTRAVIVGVSDYLDEEIPDLRFAHRDAIAFATWLQSPAGGNIPSHQVQLLVNENAKAGFIDEALDWLMVESQPQDNAIIFFSGHGDVESKTIFNRGFLLAHDSPSHSYSCGGNLPLDYLEDVTKTLSHKNVKVTIITDACRSGKLAGSDINGSQYTSSQLAQQFANEVKILSCEPNQHSLEGEQWGEGHGAFSYFLIDGLYGLADRNEDYQITLSEVRRYLEDNVVKEVAPSVQTPITFGKLSTQLAMVDEKILNDHKKRRSIELPIIAALEEKRMKPLAITDTAILKIYQAFYEALDSKSFFEPIDACADTFYQQLMAEKSLVDLHASITRRYAAFLQNDAQAGINSVLKIESEIILKSRTALAEKYKSYPLYLERSAQLLGEKHYMYKKLKARALFFDALVQWFKYFTTADEKRIANIMNNYRESLRLEPYAPHTYFYMSLGFITLLNQPDSAAQYIDSANLQAPAWVMPYASLAYFYAQKYQRFEDAKVLLDKCAVINEEHPVVLQSQAAWYFYQSDLDNAIVLFQKVIEKDSLNSNAWYNLGASYWILGKYEEGEPALDRALQLNPANSLLYYRVGFLYRNAERWEEAEELLSKSIELNPIFVAGRKLLGVVYYYQDRKEAAKQIWQEASDLNPKDIEVLVNLAEVSMELNEKQEATAFLEKAFVNGKRDYKEVVEDFKGLEEMEAYQLLLKKYFPEEIKSRE